MKCWVSVYLGGNKASGAFCKVAGYDFPPLSGEPGILALWQGSKGSLAVRGSREYWASVLSSGEASWHQKMAKTGA
jgi:hypothetical protein